MGWFLRFSSCRPPPRSAGAGMGNKAALLWHRTRFLSFGAGFGVVPAFFVLPTPPLSDGAGLGNQAALLWLGTRFLSFWSGFGAVPAFFVLPTPSRSLPGRGVSSRAITLWHRTVDFSFFFVFHPTGSPPRSEPEAI